GDATCRVVDDDRASGHRQLGTELEEVLPVQGHRDVEVAARVEHGIDSEPDPAGRLPAADLRPEALRHDGVVALRRAGGDERLARADDPIASGARHSNHEIAQLPSVCSALRATPSPAKPVPPAKSATG